MFCIFNLLVCVQAELRDVTAKANADISALRCRLEEETSKFQQQMAERESACDDEIFQTKQVTHKASINQFNIIFCLSGNQKTNSSFGGVCEKVQAACT